MTSPDIKLKNLFDPGPGRIPPLLAGREHEKAFFRDSVDRLTTKVPPRQDMIIYGPRGNGKTALLRYLQEAIQKEAGDKLEISWVTPSQFKDLAQLVGLILGNDQTLFKKALNLFERMFDDFTASANIGMASVKTSLNRSKETLVLEDLLREKSKRKPFILIIDEAHTLQSDIGQILLNASQNVRAEKCPLLLVLAGTPNLQTILNQSSATFWDRNSIFPLGRLSEKEARKALTTPLESCQVACPEKVAMQVIDRAQCYPYFIQIWGSCIADQLVKTSEREVTLETLTEVEDMAIAKCSNIYVHRFDELNRMGLVPLAVDIGSAFAENDNQPIPIRELEDLVWLSLEKLGKPATHEAVQENMQKLMHIGYIWQISVFDKTTGEIPLLCYEPGIPSLMKFVKGQRRPQAEVNAFLEAFQNRAKN